MNNRLNTMISILNSNGNPRIFVEQRIKSNPAYQQMYRQLNDEFIKSGLTQEQFIFNLFEANGINAEQVKTLAQRLNI
jgi:hypothetical protein